MYEYRKNDSRNRGLSDVTGVRRMEKNPLLEMKKRLSTNAWCRKVRRDVPPKRW
jgi:hypothetical protein